MADANSELERLRSRVIDSNKCVADCLAKVDEQFDKAYALLKAELASLRSLDPDTRTAILHDSAYIAGMKFGWNCAEANDRDRYEKVVEAHIRDVKEARAASTDRIANSASGASK